VALPCGLLAGLLKWAAEDDGTVYLEILNINTLSGTATFGAFSELVGFVVVFRTAQANSRFWQGCTSAHKMRTHWFLAACTVMAFNRSGKGPRDQCWQFQDTLIRLLSMLHAMSLAEIEEINVNVPDDTCIKAFEFDSIDPDGIDEETLKYLAACPSRVELLLSWIHNLLVESVHDGTLNMPGPVVSRIFHSMEMGTTAFYDAVKITEIPFPFPYTQACAVLLVLHWLVAPIVSPQWCKTIWATMFFVCLQVFILWSLKAIAFEIEVPFGTDANDVNGEGLQQEMNNHLLLLLDASERSTPVVRPEARPLHRLDTDVVMMSFSDVWHDNGASEIATSGRKGQTLSSAHAMFLQSNMESRPDTVGADGSGGARRSVRFDRVDEQFASANASKEMKFHPKPTEEVKFPQTPANQMTFPRTPVKVSRL